MFARRRAVLWALLRRAVSNATRHPSHLRKRFAVRTAELWEEVDRPLNCATVDVWGRPPTLRLALRYVEGEKEVLEKYRLGRTVLAWMTLLQQKYEHGMEYPQFCDLLSRVGRVAYFFEDKKWIRDAYSSLICQAASSIPRELELLDHEELLEVFYGLAWYLCFSSAMADATDSLGPEILNLKLRSDERHRLVHDLMDDLVSHAIERVDELDGTDRCRLMEGMVLIHQRLKPANIEILLHDVYPLLKSREGIYTVQPSDLASLLWAMGKHDCEDRWKIASTCLTEICKSKKFGALRAADMARAIWGLHKLKVQTGHEDFLDKVHRYLQFTVDVTRREMSNHEVIELAEGLSFMKYAKGEHDIMAYLVRDVAKRRKPLTGEQRAKFLEACQKMGYPVSAGPQTAELPLDCAG